MKKLLLATTILASVNASANTDFTLLGGLDTQNGLNVAAEVGFGAVSFGIKGLGSIESTLSGVNPDNGKLINVTENQDDLSLYGGYRLGNGMSVKAGAVWSTYSLKAQEDGVAKIDESKSVIRPMIGFGYDFSDRFTMDLHYTMSSSVDTAPSMEYKFEDSFTFLAGYRF